MAMGLNFPVTLVFLVALSVFALIIICAHNIEARQGKPLVLERAKAFI